MFPPMFPPAFQPRVPVARATQAVLDPLAPVAADTPVPRESPLLPPVPTMALGDPVSALPVPPQLAAWPMADQAEGPPSPPPSGALMPLVPEMPPESPRWLQALPLLFALGAKARGNTAAATGALEGGMQARITEEEFRARRQRDALYAAQEHRLFEEQQRLRDAEARRRQDADAARQAARQKEITNYILSVRKQAGEFTDRDSFEAFVAQADDLGQAAYGYRPGTVSRAMRFTPVPVRERARAQLDTMRTRVKAGDLPKEQWRSLSVRFDVDGDGQEETVPIRTLEELAGEAVYGPDGQPYVPAAPTRATYGEVFPTRAKGTDLADKPMPMLASGELDLGAALLNLQRAGVTPSASDRRTATTEARTRARAALEDAILGGETEDLLRSRFAGQFSSLGLSYRSEVAAIRKRLLDVGRSLVTPEEREDNPPSVDALITRGRDALTGQTGGAGGGSAPDASSGRGAGSGRARLYRWSDGSQRAWPEPPAVPGATVEDKARYVIRQQLGREPSDDEVRRFLASPRNRQLLGGS